MRRIVGVLRARLPELELDKVADPRSRRLWTLPQLLRTLLLGLMAGCRSLLEVEELTATVSLAVRQKLGIPRRMPDTTLRDLVCRLGLQGLRDVLHRLIRRAHRRKALPAVGIPFHAVAMDGKSTSLPCWDDESCQRHMPEQGEPYGLVRTVTCALITAPGRPCIDAIPIPVKTNEMGHFAHAWKSVVENFGDLFRVVTYDAGVSSEENGRLVVEAGKDYLFRLRDENRYMYKMAEELLAAEEVVAQTVDVLDNHTMVTRTLTLTEVQAHWSYGRRRKKPHESHWEHTHTFLRVESVKARDGQLVEGETRLYNSSLAHDALAPGQWLYLIRSHWGVENNNHHTLDTAFAEDERPWIEMDPRGMLVILLLRRIAYSLLTLFRSVTQRSEEARAIPWKTLLRWVWVTLVAATHEHFEDLRPRRVAAVSS